MTPLEAAAASAAATNAIAGHFMLDGATYAQGATLGFEGFSFYASGRGGVLGDVDADVVSATFGLFNPDTVRAFWEQGAPVMSRADAAAAFAQCGYAWADRVWGGKAVDVARLAELASRVTTAAPMSGAPLAAGFRALPEPASDAARALHHMNVLRELRCAFHICSVLAAGVLPLEAVLVKGGEANAAMFGWSGPFDDVSQVKADWEAAEAATDRLMARALGALSESELDEFVALVNAVEAAVA